MNKFSGMVFSIAIIIIVILVGTHIYKENKIENKKEEKTETIVKKNDLRLGVLNLDTFNPIYTKNRYVRGMSLLFYDGLVSLDENYRLKLLLADSIEKKQNLEYKIVLKDIKWNMTDEKVKSDDVAFTIEKIKEVDGIYFENIKNIAEIKILDNKTFSIILEKEDPFFIYNLTFPILKKTEDSLFKDNKKYGVPVGVGKYFLSKIENNNLIFKLNPNYFKYNTKKEDENGNIPENKLEPFIKEIIVKRFSSGQDLYSDFKSGELDILETDKIDIENFLGNYGYINAEYKGRDLSMISFNCDKINSLKIRKAISNIIDKPIILNELDKKVIDTSYILDNGSFFYSGDMDIDKNLSEAKKLLEEAGLVQKEGKWEINKQDVLVNILVNKSNVNHVKASEIIKSQMENFGIKVNLILKDNENYIKDIKDKNYDMAIFSVRNSFSPNIENFLGENNYFNYTNPNINELLKQIKNSNKINTNISEYEEEIKMIYKKIEEIYLKEIPFIPLYRNKRNYLISTGLNMESKLNENNIFQNIEKWYRK